MSELVGRGPNADDEVLSFEMDPEDREGPVPDLYTFLFDIAGKYKISVTNNETSPGVRHIAEFCADVRRAVLAAGFIEPMTGEVPDEIREEPCTDLKNELNRIYGQNRFADNHAMTMIDVLQEHGWSPPGYGPPAR